MKLTGCYVVCVISLVLSGCGGDSPDSNRGVTSEDFYQEVILHASENAVNCGEIEVGESIMNTYSCIGTSFENGEAFYATYKYQGFEGETLSAIIGSGDSVIEYWNHDDNPSGGVPASPGVINKSICADPQLNSVDIVEHTDIFTCGN